MRPALAVLATVALVGSARANSEPADRPAMTSSAREQFDRGAALYQAGDYAQAIAAFEDGQRLDPNPDFLYALAQTYRKQGDCTRAIALYQAFLVTRPPSTEAARARANLERCPLAAAPPPAAAPISAPILTTPAADDRGTPWYSDVLGDTLLGAGMIAAGVGTTYLVIGTGKLNDANRGASLDEVERLVPEGERDRKIGAWCLAGGGALALAAVVRYVLRSGTHGAADRAVRVVPRADSVTVAWEARF